MVRGRNDLLVRKVESNMMSKGFGDFIEGFLDRIISCLRRRGDAPPTNNYRCTWNVVQKSFSVIL